ncbi:MAG: hypothetical protein IJS07_00310 [Bacteroidales bacterium]|nr:hypothetical protein [Bacteroidales bacterium]
MSKKAIIACIIAAAVLLLGIAAAVMVLYSDGAPSESVTKERIERPEKAPRANKVREPRVSHKAVSRKSTEGNVYRAIPSDAAAVASFGTLAQTLEMLTDGTKAFDLLSGPMTGFMVNLRSEGVPSALESRPAALSVHYGGSLSPLLVVDAGDIADTSEVFAPVLKAAGEKICARVSSSRYGTFLLLSSSEANVLSAIRHLDSRSSILDDKAFASLSAEVPASPVLLLNHSYAGKLVPAYIQRPYSSCAEFLRSCADWSAFTIDKNNPESLEMTGKAGYGRSQAYFSNVLAPLPASDCDMPLILPGRTIFALSLCIPAVAGYRSAYEPYLDSRAALLPVKKQLEWAEGEDIREVVTAYWRGPSGNLLKANFARTAKASKESSGLRECEYQGYLADIFGKEFALRDESFCARKGAWMISGEQAAVDDVLACTQTLEDLCTELEVHDIVPSKACGPVVYFNAAATGLDNVFKPDAASVMARSLKGVSFAPRVLSYGKGGWKYSLRRCTATPAAAAAAAVSMEIPKGPFKVKNSATGRTNLFYQNDNLYLCLKEEDGKGIWGVSFDTPICGCVENVDYYANGKIQFCFCAGSSVYLIDRLGRFVSGFPVDLGKTVLLGPSVYDFTGGKGYNIIVLHDDNTIEMYNLQGRKPASWKGINCPDVVTALPELKKEGNKKYWEVRTASKTYLYDFWGGESLKKIK